MHLLPRQQSNVGEPLHRPANLCVGAVLEVSQFVELFVPSQLGSDLGFRKGCKLPFSRMEQLVDFAPRWLDCGYMDNAITKIHDACKLETHGWINRAFLHSMCISPIKAHTCTHRTRRGDLGPVAGVLASFW